MSVVPAPIGSPCPRPPHPLCRTPRPSCCARSGHPATPGGRGGHRDDAPRRCTGPTCTSPTPTSPRPASRRRRRSPAKDRRRSTSSASPSSPPCSGAPTTARGGSSPSASRSPTACPRLWRAVQAGLVAGWRARMIAQTTLALTLDTAAYVDEQVFWCASRLTPSPARPPRRGGPGPAHARPGRGEPGGRRRTSVTSPSTPSSAPSTAPCTLEANLEIPDALALAEAVGVRCGASREARLHRHRRRAACDPRWATWPVTSPPSASATPSTTKRRTKKKKKPNAPSIPGAAAWPATQIVLYAHLSADAITHFDRQDTSGTAGEVLCARLEQANQRLVSAEQVRAWCGRPDVQVVVNQVIDLRQRLECQGYHPTPEIREHVIVRDGTCVFPWCGRNARHCDLDHIIAYNHDHPEQGGPTSNGQPGRAVSPPPPVEDPRTMALRDDRTGCVHLDQPARPTSTCATTPAACATGRAWPDPGSRPFETTPARLLRTALRSTTQTAPHTRRTSSHHAPDPAETAPAGSQARPDDASSAARPVMVRARRGHSEAARTFAANASGESGFPRARRSSRRPPGARRGT